MSDLKRSNFSSGNSLVFLNSISPKWVMLSSGKPAISSRLIMELSEWFPALWLVTKRRSVEWGFGTACIGMLYIPGRRSMPKLFEKRPASISLSRWSQMKSNSFWFFGSPILLSRVSGYSPKWVSAHGQNEVFTLPHSFRPETSVSERFRAVLLGNSHICSECSISEVRANFRNSSEFFRAYSDQFRATGRNHSDMIRTYSEQIPSKFRSYPSVLIRAIPNKDEWLQSTNELLYYYYNISVVKKFAMSKDWTIDPRSWRTAAL